MVHANRSMIKCLHRLCVEIYTKWSQESKHKLANVDRRKGKVIFQVTQLHKNRYYLFFNNLDITVIIPISSLVSLNQVIIGRYVLLAFKFLGGKQFRNFKLDIFEVGTFQYRIGTYRVNKINSPKYISCTNNTYVDINIFKP